MRPRPLNPRLNVRQGMLSSSSVIVTKENASQEGELSSFESFLNTSSAADQIESSYRTKRVCSIALRNRTVFCSLPDNEDG